MQLCDRSLFSGPKTGKLEEWFATDYAGLSSWRGDTWSLNTHSRRKLPEVRSTGNQVIQLSKEDCEVAAAKYILSTATQLKVFNGHFCEKDLEYLLSDHLVNSDSKLAVGLEAQWDTTTMGVTAAALLEELLETQYSLIGVDMYGNGCESVSEETKEKIGTYCRLSRLGRGRLCDVNATVEDFIDVMVSNNLELGDIFALLICSPPTLWAKCVLAARSQC